MFIMVKTTSSPKLFSKECPKCKKVISSLSESQFKYNYEQHIKSHEREDEKR